MCQRDQRHVHMLVWVSVFFFPLNNGIELGHVQRHFSVLWACHNSIPFWVWREKETKACEIKSWYNLSNPKPPKLCPIIKSENPSLYDLLWTVILWVLTKQRADGYRKDAVCHTAGLPSVPRVGCLLPFWEEQVLNKEENSEKRLCKAKDTFQGW